MLRCIKSWQNAADDGKQCVIVDKNFVKGYFRQAIALRELGNLDGALESVKRGLGIESQNADLKKMLREIEESIRLKKVEGILVQSETLCKEGDYANAIKAANNGLRFDPDNKSLKAVIDRATPFFEKQEKQRLSTLDSKERLKEEGDNLFKAAKFEEAIVKYTKALDVISDKSSELALKCYGNRAACYKQISNFDGVIHDSTVVLEVKSDDVKSLMRRAQAYEAVERYKSALQDIRQVLALGVDGAGKQTYDLANGMQHRLSRVINQLK